MRGLRIAAIAACAAVALGGCGGKDAASTSSSGDDEAAKAEVFRNGYAEQRSVLNEISAKVGAIISGASGKTDQQLLTQLVSVEKTFRGQLDKLNALDPPDDRKQSFYQVTQAAHVTDVDLSKIAVAVSKRNGAGAQAATKQLVKDAIDLKNASAKLVGELKLPKLQGE